MRAASAAGCALPQIDFVAEAEQCLSCGAKLKVCKSRSRTVVSLAHGVFKAREILKQCSSGGPCPIVGSAALRGVVPPRQRYAYDLIVHVGMARYLDHRQREEIRAGLRETHGIEISTGSVSKLCDRFLAGLERLHVQRTPWLRAAMDGGYPLHLDATCERGRGGLFVALDGWRGWVLAAKRIRTENHEELRPLVDQTVAWFGEPVAIMRDLGDGVAGAVAPLCQHDVPDLVCHYHFLAAVGKKLLNESYNSLRHDLRTCKVRGDLRILLGRLRRYGQDESHDGFFGRGRIREELAALVLWLLEGDGHKEPLFPFSLPLLDFVRRCECSAEQSDAWVPSPRTQPERRVLRHLRTLVARLQKQPRIAMAREELDEGWQAFCELRDVLRLGNADLPRGDSRRQQEHRPQLELLRLAEIEQEILWYRQRLEQRVAATDTLSTSAIVLNYLRRYGMHLFGHPARRDEDGRVLAVVSRTNNRLEHFFGNSKQGLRRRLGKAHLARDLQEQPAQAALVANLRHPDYVHVLCGSLDKLPAAIAALEGVDIEGTTPLERDHRDHQLHRCLRKLLRPAAITARQHEAQLPEGHGASGSHLERVSLPATLEGITEHQMRTRCAEVFCSRDPRLPPVGSILTRTWHGIEYNVRVLETGFEYRDEFYASLSLITRRITDARYLNGYTFFRPTCDQKAKLKHGRPDKPAPTYPLGTLAQQIQAELKRTGYSDSTSRQYIQRTQRLANYHMCSPLDMGETEIIAHLLHLFDECGVSLGSWQTHRSALRAVYTVVLHRPQEVARIIGRPDSLRTLVAHQDEHNNHAKIAEPDAMVAATVS